MTLTEHYVRNLLERHDYIDIVVETAACRLPPHLRDERMTVLAIGCNMPNPIRDLTVSAGGIQGTLSFGSWGRSFVTVPWAAIIAAGEPGRRHHRDLKMFRATPSGYGAPEQVQAADLERLSERTQELVRHARPRLREARPAADATVAEQRAAAKGWRVIQGGRKNNPPPLAG